MVRVSETAVGGRGQTYRSPIPGHLAPCWEWEGAGHMSSVAELVWWVATGSIGESYGVHVVCQFIVARINVQKSSYRMPTGYLTYNLDNTHYLSNHGSLNILVGVDGSITTPILSKRRSTACNLSFQLSISFFVVGTSSDQTPRDFSNISKVFMRSVRRCSSKFHFSISTRSLLSFSLHSVMSEPVCRTRPSSSAFISFANSK